MEQAFEAKAVVDEESVTLSPLGEAFLRNNRTPIRRIQREIEAMNLPASSLSRILGLPDDPGVSQ
jgi:hypothetical protein